MPYAFLDDAPLEERRARAVILRRALPERADDLGRLNPEAKHGAAEDAWPSVRDADELHDALTGLVLFPESELGRFPEEAPRWMDELVRKGRAARLERNGRAYWAAAEAAPRLPAEKEIPVSIVRGWIEASGPVTAKGLAALLGLAPDQVNAALSHLEGNGQVLRGFFSGQGEEEFCDRRILARIHRATIAHLRREIEPVPASTFLRFLCEWQHISPGSQLTGEAGVLEVIDQLQGFETAAAAWENEIMRSRIQKYEPSFLDNLCMGGEVIWGRWRRRDTQAEVPSRRPGLTRTAPLGLGMREDLHWLLDETPADEMALSVPARNILGFLRRRGASFFSEIIAGARHLPSEIEDALWQLVAAGLVTADSFAALRALTSGETKRNERSRRRRRQPRRTREGRWSLLGIEGTVPENKGELWAHQYMRRYGILCRELLVRETSAPPWRTLLGFLRRSEARGELRGGRFITGVYGEQFALPEAVSALRAMRHQETSGRYVKLSACDPLNLAGILTPGPRIPAVLGNMILYRDGIPVAAIDNRQILFMPQAEAGERSRLELLLDIRPQRSDRC
jgi:ATP-dependent Lhr-like helicase